MTIEQASEFIFRVPSDSNYNKKYIVDLTPGGDDTPSCTCTNWAIQRNKKKAAGARDLTYECKHVRNVYTFQQNSKAKKAQDKKRQQEADKAEFERISAIEALRATAKELEDT